jgi:D-alanyl-D-alanine carboxypeptidase
LKHTFFASELDAVPHEKFTGAEKHQKFLHQANLINPSEPATGYQGPTTQEVPRPPRQRGAIYASALDVSLWDVGLAGDILIHDPALRKILYTPAATQDGAAVPTSGPWFFPGHPGLMVSTGSSPGFSSLLSRFTHPDELVCVTLLANKEGLDLTQLARRIAGAYDPKIGPPPGTADRRIQQSPFSVSETMGRLEKALREKNVTIMGRVDHAQAAKQAGLTLAPTEEIIFGNPAAGTLLMQANRAVALDLPLRAVAWEEKGAVWLGATDPVAIARANGITTRDEVTATMRAAVDEALRKAVSD